MCNCMLCHKPLPTRVVKAERPYHPRCCPRDCAPGPDYCKNKCPKRTSEVIQQTVAARMDALHAHASARPKVAVTPGRRYPLRPFIFDCCVWFDDRFIGVV